MRKTNSSKQIGLSIGLSLGVALGMTLFDNIAIGMCLGMSIGMALGAIKDKKINEQIEKEGYIIHSIENNKVIIINKIGEQKVINMTNEEIVAEEFSVGDIVYLDEKGMLEQAYDKD